MYNIVVTVNSKVRDDRTKVSCKTATSLLRPIVTIKPGSAIFRKFPIHFPS